MIRAAHEFVVWLIHKIGKFPRDLRFKLGAKLERQALEVLESPTRARHARQRSPLLDAVNVDLEVLRFLLRIAHDLQALPTKNYGEACRRRIDIGKQVGGRRQSSANRADSAPDLVLRETGICGWFGVAEVIRRCRRGVFRGRPCGG